MNFEIDKRGLIFKEFDYVISIGHRCTSAIGISYALMRDASYPFDWCCSINSQNILNCLKNKFEDYFTKDINSNNLVNKYGIVFSHLDHTISNEQNSEMFKRRITRFISILESN